MDLSIKVCTEEKCAVAVLDISQVGDNGYLPESSTATVKNRFRYQDTISIDVLQLNKSTGTETQNPIYTIRNNKIDSVKLPVTFDGWFTICHIVLPSVKWFEQEVKKTTASAISLYDVVYYSDGLKVYKYIDNESVEVSIDEVINRNPERTTISIVTKNYVSVCYLKKCYINLCQQLFNQNLLTECSSINKNNCELIFQRDLVWMALNVIQYLTELNQLAEAERIIEQLGRGCNGLCKQNSENVSKSGCGCS